MSIVKSLLKFSAPLALLGLGACATPFSANVARFQQMPAPEGQTFAIIAANPRNDGGLEFSQYAGLVSQRLEAKGYHHVEDPHRATLIVTLDYGVDNGQQKVVSYPTGFGYGGYGGFGYGGFGGFGHRSAFYYGWNDPFWFGDRDVESYTFYTSHLDLTINRAADNLRLFEGTAKARSGTDSLPAIVPNLVEAMFTGFPGNSGEEVRITVPPAARAAAAPPPPPPAPAPNS